MPSSDEPRQVSVATTPFNKGVEPAYGNPCRLCEADEMVEVVDDLMASSCRRVDDHWPSDEFLLQERADRAAVDAVSEEVELAATN